MISCIRVGMSITSPFDPNIGSALIIELSKTFGMTQQPLKQELRHVIAFPEVDEFYNLLQDRLHMVLERFTGLSEPFTLFITALPREKDMAFLQSEAVTLAYCGIKRQRFFLEGEKSDRIQALDAAWSKLDNYDLSSTSAVVGSKLYNEFAIGGYDLKDLDKTSGALLTYFDSILNPDENSSKPTVGQEAEYKILEQFLDLSKDRYLSLHLIQFGYFDGVVHFVYQDDDYSKLSKKSETGALKLDTRIIGNIIKSFSLEYEALILRWDLVGYNAMKSSEVLNVLSDEFYESINSNGILRELEYQKYYQKHKVYLIAQIEYNDRIPELVLSQYRRIAIMSIMIDSYAHNISAHSLTALEWWFKQRAKIVKEGRDAASLFPGEPLPIVDPDKKTELASEIQPLLRFLLDKGAFWTGLTREESFGGKISSLYSVLWYDFVNNPLYLGTIAFSEGIFRININLTILEVDDVLEGGYAFRKKILREKGVLLDGNFASVDLSFIDPDRQAEPKEYSDFIEKGPKFDAFKKILSRYKAFFPGGVVGRHAFFTILENELRNVKHYTPEERQKMQEEGLTINLSIEQDSYSVERADTLSAVSSEYYKVGVWIRQPITITRKLLVGRLTRLSEDIIIGENYRPRLGGSFQDKVCAAMLFNNTFTSVHDQETERDRRFYPWLKTGGSPIDTSEEEFIIDQELSWRRMNPDKPRADQIQGLTKEEELVWEKSRGELEESRVLFEKSFKPYTGYYKKFFHIWKGENIHREDTATVETQKWENISRFRFIITPPDNEEVFRNVRRRGVFRIIDQECKTIEEAYRHWLKRWSKTDKIHMIAFAVWQKGANGEFDPRAFLIADGQKVRFLTSDDMEREHPDQLADYYDSSKTDMQIISLSHGKGIEEEKGAYCRMRFHGIFHQYFLKGKLQKGEEDFNLSRVQIDDEVLVAELYEVLSTRICIFDNRIAKRINSEQQKLFSKSLACTIHDEDVKLWKKEKKKNLLNYHFLVIHLSFIEAFRKKNGEKKYDEDNIESFIKEEILQGEDAPENFVLVITTGRGRTQWWEGLKGGETNYPTFTTFRPVETLIAAVENAISISDDIELKYRLVKVLFGS